MHFGWDLGSSNPTTSDRYTPANGKGSKTYGDFEVRVISGARSNGYKIADLQIVHSVTGETRQLRHFWFDTWPDYGVPTNPIMVTKLLLAVRECVAF
jgi:protein tyrosine phosphatase